MTHPNRIGPVTDEEAMPLTHLLVSDIGQVSKITTSPSTSIVSLLALVSSTSLTYVLSIGIFSFFYQGVHDDDRGCPAVWKHPYCDHFLVMFPPPH